MTFDDYKNKVSIIQVAVDLGYKLDKQKGKVSPVFKLFDTNQNKIDEIVIKEPTDFSRQHYFDRNQKGGDLISFIKNHIDQFPQFQHSNPYVKINMILSHYANTPYSPVYTNSLDLIRKGKDFDLSGYSVGQAKLTDLTYLTNERNISPETVQKFLPFIKMVRENDKQYTNIAFPYQVPGADQITNFELRNYDFKGMPEGGDKQKSSWIAAFSAKPTNVYFAESAIDAMSFADLNKNKINLDSSAFISTGGNMSNQQIKNVLTHFKGANFHSLFDNDLAGHIYDIRVACLIQNRDVKFFKSGNDITVSTGDKSFTVEKEKLSLEKFREETGIKPPLKIHKPKLNDFNEVLKSKNEHSKHPRL